MNQGKICPCHSPPHILTLRRRYRIHIVQNHGISSTSLPRRSAGARYSTRASVHTIPFMAPTIGCRLGFDDLRREDPQVGAMNGIVCTDARVEYLAPADRRGNEVEEIPWFCTMCIRYLLRRVRMCGGEWQGHIFPWFIR